MKEAFYFPHDNNAINDPKMMSVLMSAWLSWIWLYWIIIESMHQQDSWMLTVSQYEQLIQWYSRWSDSIDVQQVLNSYSESWLFLFTWDWKVFSKRVVENKKYREELIEKKRNAWKMSAEKRASAKENQEEVWTGVEHVLNTTPTRKGKERKGKEIKTETETEKYIKEKKILEIWNSFWKNIQHQESAKIISSISKALEKFDFETIKNGIEIYSKVLLLGGWFSYRWTIEEFLKREWGLNTFQHKKVSDYAEKPKSSWKPFVDYEAIKRETLNREKKADQEKRDFDNQKALEKQQDDKILIWFESLPEDSELKKNIEKAIDENKTIKLWFDSLNSLAPGTLMYEQKLESANKQRERLKIVVIRQFYS